MVNIACCLQDSDCQWTNPQKAFSCGQLIVCAGIFLILNIFLKKKEKNFGLSTTTNFISIPPSISAAASTDHSGYGKHNRNDNNDPTLRQNGRNKQSQAECKNISVSDTASHYFTNLLRQNRCPICFGLCLVPFQNKNLTFPKQLSSGTVFRADNNIIYTEDTF